MAEHLPPPDPARIAAAAPEIHCLPAGSELARVWFADSEHPTGFARFRTFGPTESRFDHHLADPSGAPAENADRGILYAIEVGAGSARMDDGFCAALAEVFQQTGVIELGAGAPRLATFRIARPLALLDLTGFFTVRVGASALLSSGPRETTRAWSGAFHAEYTMIDGLRYRSSMSGGAAIAVALYERAVDAAPASPEVDLPLDHPDLRASLVRAAARLGYPILPGR